MGIAAQFISGIMVGIEVLWEENGLVIDLGIIRLIFFFGIHPEE